MAVAHSNSIQQLRVCFGQPATRLVNDERGLTVELPLPHLAGPSEELVLETAAPAVQRPLPGLAQITGDHWMAGAILRPCQEPLDTVSARLYQDLLRQTRGWNICRIWNYLPDINNHSAGLENYRLFNLGRWRAYHDTFGDTLPSHLPAASAVGLADNTLVTVFVATQAPIRRIENPRQLPAWSYPPAYGPKSPCFVRATTTKADGRHGAWISGTASIRGHQSLAIGSVTGQLAITVENLALVQHAMQLAQPQPTPTPELSTKVYLRRAGDLETVRSALGARGADALFVEAAICRSELELEIECSGLEPAARGAA